MQSSSLVEQKELRDVDFPVKSRECISAREEEKKRRESPQPGGSFAVSRARHTDKKQKVHETRRARTARCPCSYIRACGFEIIFAYIARRVFVGRRAKEPLAGYDRRALSAATSRSQKPDGRRQIRSLFAYQLTKRPIEKIASPRWSTRRR